MGALWFSVIGSSDFFGHQTLVSCIVGASFFPDPRGDDRSTIQTCRASLYFRWRSCGVRSFRAFGDYATRVSNGFGWVSASLF